MFCSNTIIIIFATALAKIAGVLTVLSTPNPVIITYSITTIIFPLKQNLLKIQKQIKNMLMLEHP